jgi:hypothetical protein
LLFLGWVPHKPLDFTCFLFTFHHDLWWSDPPCRCGSYTPRSNFAPTMTRNLTFGSASSRPSSQWQGSDPKNSNMPML